MIDFFFAMIAAAAAAGQDSEQTATVAPLPSPAVVEPAPSPSTVVIGENVQIGVGTSSIEGGGTSASPLPQIAPTNNNGPDIDETVIPAGLEAEPQTPSGKFTTATEIKPIMAATRGNWVALREYEGNDLLYVTHIWSWRCGLKSMAISVNDEPMQNWPLPACHDQYASPNAILPDDGLPYLTLKLGGVQTIAIQLVYDDLSREVARFDRSDVLIP